MKNTKDNIILMTAIAERGGEIGKTAMMKLTYLLQTLYDVPFENDYQIYTYGPYSQNVMSDIEYAVFMDLIEVESITYPGGLQGYQIHVTDAGKSALQDSKELIDLYSEKIDTVISYFGSRTAKELELYSTIVFIFNSYKEKDWEITKSEICSSVQSIKPHFSFDTISDAYDDLSTNNYLSL